VNRRSVNADYDVDEEIYSMDDLDGGHEMFVTTQSMTLMHEPSELTCVPNARIIVQLVLDPNCKKYQALINSGASLSLALHYLTSCTPWKHLESPLNVTTKTGHFQTDAKIELEILLPNFSPHQIINFEFHNDTNSQNLRYDFIFGRDFLQYTRMTLNYREQVFEWDDVSVPMPVEHQAVLKVEQSQNEGRSDRFILHQDIEEVLLIHLNSHE
jgi:hypothetical protein